MSRPDCSCYRVTLALVLAGSFALRAGASHPLVVDGLSVDGRRTFSANDLAGSPAQVRLSPGPHQLTFSFGPPDDSGPPLRLRYQLLGQDSRHREAGGEMRLSLMVFNAADEVLGLHESALRGESEGWSNSLSASRFRQRVDFFELPPDAAMLRVIFNSGTWDTRAGASHPTVGFAAIDDCRLWVEGPDGQRRNIWPNSDFSEGEDLDQPTGRPRGWTRSALGETIPQVLQVLPRGHMLALVDENFRSGGEWRCDFPLADLGLKGGRVDIEWKELFTVGAAGGHTAEYPLVPPGEYVFRVWGVTPTGEPTDHEVALAITIPQVFWKTTPFIASSGTVFALGIAGLARALTRRRMQREVTQLQQQRTLERERTRIARDIHDDLGTSLTSIALLCQSVRGALPPGSAATEDLDHICSTSREMTRKLEEIVWAVDPAHDSLDSIANYLGRFAQDFLSTAGMSCRLDLPVQLPSQPISAEVRHNLFLAFKETLNNTVRHAEAREVKVTLTVTDQHFTLTIADDGKGMVSNASPTATGGGHGLSNIRDRLTQIGGEAEVTSMTGRGTLVRLTVPWQAAARGAVKIDDVSSRVDTLRCPRMKQSFLLLLFVGCLAPRAFAGEPAKDAAIRGSSPAPAAAVPAPDPGGSGYRLVLTNGAARLPVAVVRGTPYQMGWHLGRLMQQEIQKLSPAIVTGFKQELHVTDEALDLAWAKTSGHTDPRVLQQLVGLAEGSGQPVRLLQHVHCLPLLLPYSCSSIAAWGSATEDGHLYQTRNLDWSLEAGAHEFPVVVVYLPTAGRAHVTPSFAGFIGAHCGMNEAGIALSEIGDASADEMPYNLHAPHFTSWFRALLYEADSLSTALTLFSRIPPTKRYHFVFGDGRTEKRAVKIRAASGGRLAKPQVDIWKDNDAADELAPRVLAGLVYHDEGRGAFPFLQAQRGRLNGENMVALANQIPIKGGNVMNAVFDVTAARLWISYAGAGREAYERPYLFLDLMSLDADADGRPDWPRPR